jgi:uncharacterized membrane protein YedE/YeeE
VNARPLFIARYGVYAAVAVALLSGWLAYRAGNPVDASLMRAVFVFVLFTGLGFGAEAVIATAPGRARHVNQPPPQTAPQHAPAPEDSQDEDNN